MAASLPTRAIGAALVGAALVGATLVGAAVGNRTQAVASPALQPPSRTAGLEAFEIMRGVLQHPRCRNCHAAGDAPLQGDDSRRHDMNVRRGADGRGEVGERCATCHGTANLPASYGSAQPPGVATGWRMPAPDTPIIFAGTTSPALCKLVRTRAQRASAALRRYLDDPLVLWAWAPGPGRQPIPISHATFVEAFDVWARAGSPCPD